MIARRPPAPDLRLSASRAIACSAPRVNFRYTFSMSKAEQDSRSLGPLLRAPYAGAPRPPFVRSVVSAMPARPEARPAPFIVRASARKGLQSRWSSTRFLMEGSNLRLSSKGIIQVDRSNRHQARTSSTGRAALASLSAPPFGCRARAGGFPSRGLGRGHYSTIARGTGAVHPAHP